MAEKGTGSPPVAADPPTPPTESTALKAEMPHPATSDDQPRSGLQCTICLDDDGAVVQKGCCCRGDAGAAHLPCLVELATHMTDHNRNWHGWTNCGTCNAGFTGAVLLGLAEARVRRAESRPDATEKVDATACLAAAQYQQGEYASAALLMSQVLTTRLRTLGELHPDVLTAKNNLALMYGEQGGFPRPTQPHDFALVGLGPASMSVAVFSVLSVMSVEEALVRVEIAVC